MYHSMPFEKKSKNVNNKKTRLKPPMQCWTSPFK
jgi:hypothetical protein